MDDETKLTLHGLQQYYVKLKDSEKNRKLFDLLDVLEFNQVGPRLGLGGNGQVLPGSSADPAPSPSPPCPAGGHLREVCAALHGPGAAPGGAELPGHRHPPGHGAGGAVSACVGAWLANQPLCPAQAPLPDPTHCPGS